MTVVPEEPLSEAVRVVRPGVDDAVAAADNGGRLIGGSRRSEDGEKGQEQAHARWLCQHGPAGKRKRAGTWRPGPRSFGEPFRVETARHGTAPCDVHAAHHTHPAAPHSPP